jgi:uncharacterized protein YndB with AHSA1/START domain
MPDTLRVQHRFNVVSERVYDAFVTPELAGKFLFATPAGQMVRTEVDPKIGGRFVFVDRRDGEEVEHVGKFLELVRPTRLVFEFQVPKYSPVWTRVSIDIVADSAGCELVLVHQGVPPEAAERSASGWQKVLAALAQLLAAPTEVAVGDSTAAVGD